MKKIIEQFLYEIYIEAGMTDGLAKLLAKHKAEVLLDRMFCMNPSYERGGQMDIDKLRKELEVDEGRVEKIYKDHLGYPTFGIGHLITEKDPEHGQPIDTPVSAERVNQAFETDVMVVLTDCEILYPDFYDKPEEVQLIIANMMFNLGRTRLSKFKNMKKAVDAEDWNKAADEMMDSAWYRQVPNRAKRLVNRMRNV